MNLQKQCRWRRGARAAILVGAVGLAGIVTTTEVAGQGSTAVAGPIVHKVTGLSVLDVVPASWTLERFKNIAKASRPPDGFVWYILRGTATNKAAESRSINSTTYSIVTGGVKYKPYMKTTLYVPSDMNVAHIEVQPGDTAEWSAFFMVPADATGLKLKATDLTFSADNIASFNLPDPAKRKAVKKASGGKAKAGVTAAGPTRVDVDYLAIGTDPLFRARVHLVAFNFANSGNTKVDADEQVVGVQFAIWNPGEKDLKVRRGDFFLNGARFDLSPGNTL